MKNKRIRNLKFVKGFYIFIDTVLMMALILSLLFFKLSIPALIIIDLGIFAALFLINYEVYISGFEKVANTGLTRTILSDNKFKKVIPVAPPEDVKTFSNGTHNYLKGYIHNSLVESAKSTDFYAMVSPYGETVQISKKCLDEPGVTFVGTISPEDFPYFYELSDN